MIPTSVQVFLALEPIDLRWSFDRLAGVAHEQVRIPQASSADVRHIEVEQNELDALLEGIEVERKMH